ncbi:MAG: CoA transferase [Deltaproteobacteria bacterium]|nr:CoA transferase [Deltaproteobacteria bacterium]
MNKADFYRDARQDLPGPLAGLRVLEACTTWAGPMCTSLLADMGADVIKTELPEGEVIRSMPPFLPDAEPPLPIPHATLNRNKRSLSLNLRTPDGREIFLKIAARVDIVVQNFRPGTMDKWGVGYEAVRSVKPDIIYVSISGFGQFGPEHDRAGYDTLAQALSGFMALNGEPNGGPVRAATALGDDLAGLHAALSALAAVYHHRQTGEGQHIDVSLLDSVLFQSNGFLTLGALGIPNPRLGNESPFAFPANVYACNDGHIRVAVVLDSHWKVLVRLLNRPELADDPEYAALSKRMNHREEVNAMIAVWCAARSSAEAIAQCLKAGLAVAPIRTYEQAARDPHILARDMLQDTPQANGVTIPITGPAAKFSRTPTRVRSGAPVVGAHDEEILQDLGLTAADIAQLRQKGVLVRKPQ